MDPLVRKTAREWPHGGKTCEQRKSRDSRKKFDQKKSFVKKKRRLRPFKRWRESWAMFPHWRNCSARGRLRGRRYERFLAVIARAWRLAAWSGGAEGSG